MQLSEQELVRRNAKEQLEQLGINPYPSKLFPVTHYAKDIKKQFDESKGEEFKEVTLAGRLMSRRIMGSASFAELQDSSGRIQFYVRRDDIGSVYFFSSARSLSFSI